MSAVTEQTGQGLGQGSTRTQSSILGIPLPEDLQTVLLFATISRAVSRMLGHSRVLPCLNDLNGVVLNYFTVSRWTRCLQICKQRWSVISV